MTKRERAQVVEFLRCAADRGSLSIAGDWLGYGLANDRGVAHWAWESKRAVQSERPDEFLDNDAYSELLLEAAARVEEGSWP